MTREPIFNAPQSVVACLAVLAAVHVVFWFALPLSWAGWLIELLAVIPARYAGYASQLAGGWWAAIWSLATHQLLHGDFGHLLLNTAWLLVFGGAVATRIGNWRFLALGILSGVAGALAFVAFRFGDPIPMIGASGAVSGLMGGAFRFFFSALDRGGFEAFRSRPRAIPLMSVRETLSDRRFQVAAGVIVLINLLLAVLPQALTSAEGVAWQAHLGGFLFGLLAFDAFEPRRPKLEIVRPTLH